MDGKIAVIIPELTEGQRTKIRAAAEKHGYEIRFMSAPEEDNGFLQEAEIVFGHLPETARTSKKLRWLCTPYAGVDQFMREGAFANPEAILSNSSGAYGVAISEHVVMILLDILRRQPEYQQIVRDRQWKRNLRIRSICGSRITLLGTGDIGQQTAIRLKAFSPARITGVNRSGRNPGFGFDCILTCRDWESVLPETDVLIASLPGTRETYHMVGGEQLALLPDGAVFINVGRGSTADQAALIRELERGRLYAGLDVFEQEPLPADDPAWNLQNLLITPHTAGNMALGYTVERVAGLFLEDLDRYCAGKKPERLIDRARGY